MKKDTSEPFTDGLQTELCHSIMSIFPTQ